MLIKCCGLRLKENVQDLIDSKLDMMGFIYYSKSKRFVNEESFNIGNKTKVGVFVDSTMEYVKSKVETDELDFIQLHGSESPEYCADLAKTIPVMKAFNVGEDFDFEVCEEYTSVKYFLFDAKGKLLGGNGIRFNWKKLNEYKGDTPFFLSGGIGINDIADIKALSHEKMIGVDINSGFELSPGVKDTALVKEFIKCLK